MDRRSFLHTASVAMTGLAAGSLGDPMRYLEKYRDRYWSFHLKDVVADRSRDTELGAGVLDLARIVAAIPDIEQKPCFVEQEGAVDPLTSARRNFEFLRKLA
jgi:sugar phosphate isomerase/epimerase